MDNVATRGRWLGFAELLAAAYVGRDPASYAEAMRSVDAGEWTTACQYEMDALAKNGTWELVDLPPNRKAVKSNGSSSSKRMATTELAWWLRGLRKSLA